jgi:acyl transferase domain-containing protein
MEAFGRLLRDGIDAVSLMPKDRWDLERHYSPDPDQPGKMYTRFASFVESPDRFDSEFFGISARETESMDPQQRLLLEIAWEALENAGMPASELHGTRTGVFAGISTSDYLQYGARHGRPEQIDAYLGTGCSPSVAAGRLSYTLGLVGPNYPIDTACSSALVALHLACLSLRHRDCRVALAGGVNLMLIPETFVYFCKMRALSLDGRCKTFDAAADGYGRGEGCGMVVLKRLSDAQADGDTILALIRGSDINHDGRSNGLTVPNGLAQESVIRQALANARVEPHEISYVISSCRLEFRFWDKQTRPTKQL